MSIVSDCSVTNWAALLLSVIAPPSPTVTPGIAVAPAAVRASVPPEFTVTAVADSPPVFDTRSVPASTNVGPL